MFSDEKARGAQNEIIAVGNYGQEKLAIAVVVFSTGAYNITKSGWSEHIFTFHVSAAS